MAIKSEGAKFQPFMVEGIDQDPLKAGEKLGNWVKENQVEGEKSLLIICPDFRTNVTELFKGIESNVTVPIVGGLTGDNFSFKKCYQFDNENIKEFGCSATLITGDFDFKTVITHGSQPIGDPVEITKKEGNVIHELDNRPAVDVLGERFGEPITSENSSAATTIIGIGQRVDSDYFDPYVLAAALAIDLDAKTLTMPVELDENLETRIMRRETSSILKGSSEAGIELMKQMPKPPKLVLHFDCGGRGKLLMGNEIAIQEVTAFQDKISKEVPWFGVYTYGEIGPVGNKNHFHNYTATILAFF